MSTEKVNSNFNPAIGKSFSDLKIIFPQKILKYLSTNFQSKCFNLTHFHKKCFVLCKCKYQKFGYNIRFEITQAPKLGYLKPKDVNSEDSDEIIKDRLRKIGRRPQIRSLADQENEKRRLKSLASMALYQIGAPVLGNGKASD